MTSERDNHGQSIVDGKFDLDNVSPDACNVQEHVFL